MSEYEKKVVEDLRRNARKSGVWSPGKEDMQTAADLRREGYAACVCYGWQSAATVIVGYLKEGKLDVDQENHRTMQEK